MSPKIDLKKDLKRFYSAATEPSVIDVPSAKFLTVVGQGEPGGSLYQKGVEALFTAAYTLKFQEKSEGRDFTVMGLEGLWWWDPPATSIEQVPRELIQWKSMIKQPDFVTGEMASKAKASARKRGKGGDLLDQVVLEEFHEGLCVQIMHIGPYSEEGRSIAKLSSFIEENNLRMRGHHHEIYLSDPRRTAPEKIKTIIRHPIESK
ncbi:MAG: GyrI-like domain-containing protein [Thaumarchaeota archaeon]|nr:GyrI-like domain-containing protein [Nitrososphaerota archaeon]